MRSLIIEHAAIRRGLRAVLEPGRIETAAPASIAIVGVNGSGKSSLFMQLTDTLLGGRGRARITIDGAAPQLAYVPQVPALPAWLRMSEVTRAFGLDWQSLRDSLPQLLLGELDGRRVGQLSLGQRQALAIALALGRRADLTLLDEPFSALDFRRRVGAIQLLRARRDEGRSIMISSQSAADLASLCDHYVVIRDGRQVFNGRAAELAAEKTMEAVEQRLLQLLC